MGNNTPDVRDKILEYIFPNLRYGEDPDIDLYFELRSSGRMLDALSIYKSRLRLRYPNDEKRIILLKLYRTKSPLFQAFLHKLLLEQADNFILRIKHNLDVITNPLTNINIEKAKTFIVLKATEKIARLFPGDPEQAKDQAATYDEFAKILNYKYKEMHQAAYLLGELFDQAAIDDSKAVDFIASSLAYEKEKQKKLEEKRKNFFSLDKIEFDQEDVKKIKIPENLHRDEDIVLAYCFKYWLKVKDSAFERIIWLYSKKYNTIHYTVFRAIKIGRQKKYSDDDILTLVATTIATRYSYTVQGDLYMQAAWKKLKASLYSSSTTISKQVIIQTEEQKTKIQKSKAQKENNKTKKLAKIEKDKKHTIINSNNTKTNMQNDIVDIKAKTNSNKINKSKIKADKEISNKVQVKKNVENQNQEKQKLEKQSVTNKSSQTITESNHQKKITKPEIKNENTITTNTSIANNSITETLTQQTNIPTYSEKPIAEKETYIKNNKIDINKVFDENEPLIVLKSISQKEATGSISDYIKKISGKAYDVYRELFLSKVRPHIRKTLVQHRKSSSGKFGETLNQAENLVFSFIEKNYSNSFMDWQNSNENKEVSKLGYELSSLDKIIESCYKVIK